MKMHYAISLLFVVCFVQGIFGEQCLSDQWPPKPDRVLPTYIVNLDVPPQERWKAVTAVYKDQLNDLLAYMKAFIVEVSPDLKFLIDLVDTKLPVLADELPAPYGDEMKGISQASGLKLGEVVLYNIFYEVSSFCTSIVAQDQNGNIFHGRNLDFGGFMGWDKLNHTWALAEKLRTLMVQINYTQNGQVLFKTTTFLGYVGSLTGIKPGVFSVSINSRMAADGGYIGLIEWIYNLNRSQSFITFAIRDMLTHSQSYDQSVKYLSEVPLIAPCYYIVAGTKPKQGVIISRARNESAGIQLLGKDNSWFIIETNYDNWKPQPIFDDRLTPCIKCMQAKGRNQVSFEILFNVLSSRPMLNKQTVYTSLMEPATGRFEGYWQLCRDEDAPCRPW
jgi:acid ceramidase